MSSPVPTASETVPSDRRQECAACHAPLRGRYCAACGALGESVACVECGTSLIAGDRFCPGCGASARAGASGARASRPARTTWLVVGGAAAALLAFTLVRYAQQERADDAIAATQEVSAPGSVGTVTAPDISTMTPQQQADRLFDRIMRLKDEGKIDSVRFFVPMALAVYQRLGPLNADQRYDLGTIAHAAGMYEVGRAQADSILRENPTHLLGLVLATRSASGLGNEARAAEYRRRLLAAEQRELQTGRPEYSRHATDIRDAIEAARRE
jgi:hypothetical protein